MTIFRLDPTSNLAERVSIVYGKSSVGEIQIVDGLKPGDRVVLNDMSDWDDQDKIRIQ